MARTSDATPAGAPSTGSSDPLLRWRSEFPILEKKKGYLINNSLGAMPRQVYDNLKAYADTWATDGVMAWEEWLPMVTQTGDLIGKIIGAAPGSVMMHQNVSTFTAILLSCFDWKAPRNRIVTTQLNFPSILYNHLAASRRGAETVMVAGEGSTVPTERIIAAIDDRTQLVSLDLVLFRSSAILDVKPVIDRAHAVGAKVVLDCYQATGAIPIDVVDLDVDFLMGGSVKWLCGGAGAAYLYVKPSVQKTVEPQMTGWFSHKRPFGFEVAAVDYADDIHRFMGGSPSVPALYAAKAGYEIIAKVGVEAIRAKSQRLTSLIMELADDQKLQVNTPRNPSQRGGTVCVDFDGSEAMHHELIRRGYIIDWRPNGGIRISPTSTTPRRSAGGSSTRSAPFAGRRTPPSTGTPPLHGMAEWADAVRRSSPGSPPATREVTPSRHDLHQAIATGRTSIAVIAEYALRSPEEGELPKQVDLTTWLNACDDAEVAALALPTDDRFGGSDLWLRTARAKEIPLLHHRPCLSRDEVIRSRLLGADAVWTHAAFAPDLDGGPRDLQELPHGRAGGGLRRGSARGRRWTRAPGSSASLSSMTPVPRTWIPVLELRYSADARTHHPGDPGTVSSAVSLETLRGKVDAVWICCEGLVAIAEGSGIDEIVRARRAHERLGAAGVDPG